MISIKNKFTWRVIYEMYDYSRTTSGNPVVGTIEAVKDVIAGSIVEAIKECGERSIPSERILSIERRSGSLE